MCLVPPKSPPPAPAPPPWYACVVFTVVLGLPTVCEMHDLFQHSCCCCCCCHPPPPRRLRASPPLPLFAVVLGMFTFPKVYEMRKDQLTIFLPLLPPPFF
jgi:hypothetical protein